ncbi:unnamed protein product [Effrenium voratum]|uniref:Uncharacterized protein n=1 Tax=Effrenium voratum TaxID=2562239 RepID=A0AA36NAQ9_9DINO|nr:unnamed protein product [Effrenium voratum]
MAKIIRMAQALEGGIRFLKLVTGFLSSSMATLILQILDQLDGHQNNRVDFKHFVNCARKFKGHATKIEMLTLMYDHTRLMENLQEEFRQLRALVNR